MKSLFASALILFASLAFANPFQGDCSSMSEEAVEKMVKRSQYTKDGIITEFCELASNKKVFVCLVAANRTDGETIETYSVVLDVACKKVYRVQRN